MPDQHTSDRLERRATVRHHFRRPSWHWLLPGSAAFVLAVLGIPVPPLSGRSSSVTPAEEREWWAAMHAWVEHDGLRYGYSSFFWLALALGLVAYSSVIRVGAFKDTRSTVAVLIPVLAALVGLPSLLALLGVPLTNFDPTDWGDDPADAVLPLLIVAALLIAVIAIWDAVRLLIWRRSPRPRGRNSIEQPDEG